jgi:prolyl oligopeptidase
MIRRLFALACAAAASLLPLYAQQTQTAATVQQSFTYPVAAKGYVVDDYFGTKVADPYRWMEDLDSPATHAWVEAENKVTFDYLDTLPTRAPLKARLTQLVNYERYGAPFQIGGRYFYSHNDGLQNQIVYYTQSLLTAPAHILLDPNTLSKDGTVAIRTLGISHDGRLMAYTLSEAGSDWETIHVRDVATGQDRPDVIHWSKFSQPSWTTDDRGFFYSACDSPVAAEQMKAANYNQKVYYHRLGTPQADDRLVYARPDHKDWYLGGGVTDDGRYLILGVSPGSIPRNGVFYQDLRDKSDQTVELLPKFDAKYGFIDNDGPVFWFRTDLDAPRGRIVAIDIRHPEPQNWREVVPQTADTLEGVSTVGGRFLVHF